jgi:hypothetical protein
VTKVSPRNSSLREHQILKELSAVVSSVMKPIDFIVSTNVECIILEDFGGLSLRNILRNTGCFKNNIEEFLDIAIKITDTLSTIYDNFH